MKPAEQYICNQKEPLKSILIHIQILIETNFTNVELLYKWKIPFYYLKGKPLCYLNATKKGFVDVGFYAKPNFKLHTEYLVSENRKAVKSLRYYNIEEINANILITVLKGAYKDNAQ